MKDKYILSNLKIKLVTLTLFPLIFTFFIFAFFGYDYITKSFLYYEQVHFNKTNELFLSELKAIYKKNELVTEYILNKSFNKKFIPQNLKKISFFEKNPFNKNIKKNVLTFHNKKYSRSISSVNLLPESLLKNTSNIRFIKDAQETTMEITHTNIEKNLFNTAVYSLNNLLTKELFKGIQFHFIKDINEFLKSNSYLSVRKIPQSDYYLVLNSDEQEALERAKFFMFKSLNFIIALIIFTALITLVFYEYIIKKLFIR